jgi:hypothetical protein
LAPSWTRSAFKHDIPKADQVWAMVNATFQADLPGESLDDGTVRLYIGPPHAQTDREIEILVNVYADGREARVFHAMDLGAKYRRLREENSDD